MSPIFRLALLTLLPFTLHAAASRDVKATHIQKLLRFYQTNRVHIDKINTDKQEPSLPSLDRGHLPNLQDTFKQVMRATQTLHDKDSSCRAKETGGCEGRSPYLFHRINTKNTPPPYSLYPTCHICPLLLQSLPRHILTR